MMQDQRMNTRWLSSRKNGLLRRIECLCAETAVENRRTQRRLQEVEEAIAMSQPEQSRTCGTVSAGQCAPGTSSRTAQQQEIELLNRKLAAACAEIRRYETRLFAYERAMLALRKENAELQALCEKARDGEKLPEPETTPQPPVLDKPELPVIHFPSPARDAGAAQSGPSVEIETLLDTGTPEWEPKTKLDHLSVDILSQLKQLMGT